jgi:hypothetical protein
MHVFQDARRTAAIASRVQENRGKKQSYLDPEKANSDSAGCAGRKADGMAKDANSDQGYISMRLPISIGDSPVRLLIVPTFNSCFTTEDWSGIRRTIMR